MADSPSNEMKQEEKLITLWQDYPCLYHVSSKEFKNRTLRDKSVEELAKEVNNTGEWVKKKMRYLRNVYTKSLSPPKSGSERKNVNTRTKWLQEKLSFLAPHVVTRRGAIDTLSASSSSNSSFETVDVEEVDDCDHDDEDGTMIIATSEVEPSKKKKLRATGPTRKAKKEDEELKLIQKIAESACNSQPKAADKYDLFGQYVSSSLRDFDDTTTRHIVQHRIGTIIFEAQMGALTMPTMPHAHPASANPSFYSGTMSDNNPYFHT